jgi:hypothetical protein
MISILGPVSVEIYKRTVFAIGSDSRLIVCDMLVSKCIEVGESPKNCTAVGLLTHVYQRHWEHADGVR